jgi:hypothetical protein
LLLYPTAAELPTKESLPPVGLATRSEVFTNKDLVPDGHTALYWSSFIVKSWRKLRLVRRAETLPLSCADYLNLLKPSGPVQACTGIDFL